MDGTLLQDRLSRGMGAAARVFGLPYDAYRPAGSCDPLRPEARFLRMPAAFDGGDPGYRRPLGYERALRGTFDSAYLRVGDLLCGQRGTLFVALLPPLYRPLCVLANAVLSAARPAGPVAPGLGDYGGSYALDPVMSGWPAQVLAGGSGRGFGLPADGALSGFHILLPLGAPATRTGDAVTDDTGRTYVVGAAELTELGWRLHARQVGA